MDVLCKDEIRRIDNLTQTEVKSYDLMEKAGYLMSLAILKHYTPKKVLLLVGSGGNGGDSLVVGRYLLDNGILVDAYLISEIKNEDSKRNLELFKGNIVKHIDFSSYDMIVDGILGNNQEKPLKDDLVDLVNQINISKCVKVSLDMPTGINTDNGLSLGSFIQSDLTLTVEYPKLGLYLNDGLSSYDKLEVIKIGLKKPKDIYHVNEENDFLGYLEKRTRNSNKQTFKRTSIIAGSLDYPGASLISYNALNAFMMGVGYTYLYVPKSLYEIYALRFPEIIVGKLSDNFGYIKFNKDELDKIMNTSDSIAIGMGMGISEDLYNVIKYILSNYTKKVIIDADGLNTISKYGVDILKNAKCEVIITPHPKEFSRLSGLSIGEIINNPIDVTKAFAKKYNICVLLKGASSIISDGIGVRISAFGNTALAKGGSGDALSGILAGVLASVNKKSIDAASLAAYILGMSAMLASKEESERTLTISKITKFIPSVIKNLEIS